MRHKLEDTASVEDTQALDVVEDQDTPEVSAPPARKVRLRTREAHRTLRTEHGEVSHSPVEFTAADAEAIQAAAKKSGVALVVEDA